MSVNEYTCPHCGERQTKVIQWQTVSMASEFDLETKESNMIETSGGEHEDWCCPNCDESIQAELGDEIQKVLFG